jgi:hypothetical protein
MNRKRLFGALLAGVLSVGGFVFQPIEADAAFLQVWVCNGAGRMIATTHPNNTRVDFVLEATARCLNGDQAGPYISTIRGAGRANAVGGCAAGLPLLVTNLNIDVAMVATSVTNGRTRTELMRWTLPVSTYPNVTPFLIAQRPADTVLNLGLSGAGNIISTGKACSGNTRSSGILVDFVMLDKLFNL